MDLTLSALSLNLTVSAGILKKSWENLLRFRIQRSCACVHSHWLGLTLFAFLSQLFHLHVTSEASSHKHFHLCQISIAKGDHIKLAKHCVTVLSMCTQHGIKRLHTVFALSFTHSCSFSFISQSLNSQHA